MLENYLNSIGSCAKKTQKKNNNKKKTTPKKHLHKKYKYKRTINAIP